VADSRIQLKQHKWFDRIDLDPGIVETAAAVRFAQALLERDMNESLDIVTLPLTKYEQSAVTATVVAINAIRCKLGLEQIHLSNERVHYVPTEEYQEKIGESSGIAGVGHVYIRANMRARFKQFANVLVHEMVHMSSFAVLAIQLDVIDGQIQLVACQQTRFGLQQNNGPEDEFVGLNEAITEYAALLVRYEASRQPSRFAKRCAKTRHQITTHLAAFRVMQGAIGRLVEARPYAEWTEKNRVYRDLLIDYWGGRNRVLAALEQLDGELYHDLRLLDDNHNHALALARKHGFKLSSKD